MIGTDAKDPNTSANEIDDDESKKEIAALLSLAQIQIEPSINFENIKKLNLYDCDLSSLPSSLPSALPNLSILFCSKNNFEEVPEIIGRCLKLQMVAFKSNRITRIHPESLGPQMRWLILTDNAIASIPSSIGKCAILQKLMLSGNKISELPAEIGQCQNLELVRLSSNQLHAPPMTLLQLPKLAWVALSDNPFLQKHIKRINGTQTSLSLFEQDHLDDSNLGEVLGSGASGVTRKYTVESGEVAVKEFSATITSDGNPEEERRICVLISALKCLGLVKMLGQTKKGSIVMELLKNYEVFGGSPSFDSCSRDVYSDDVKITKKQAIAMVSKLLNTLCVLHQNGICHGDFYGHNILISQEDETVVKLSDFGAAFCYETHSDYGKFIEQIEVRAYGHLVNEICDLLSRNENCEESQSIASALSKFCKDCHVDYPRNKTLAELSANLDLIIQ